MVENHPENQLFLPKVSVIVPIYNGEGDLPDLIECLRSQTYPPDSVEYLLVDNHSSDRTATILEALTAETKHSKLNHPSFRSLVEHQIQSSYAARNVGIRAASGDILAFTDVDCRPIPTWLEALMAPFIDPEVAIAAGEILPLPGHTLWEQQATRQETLSQKHTLAHPFCPYGQTANLAIRRQVLEQVGLFRAYLTTGGDADLCWRILRSTSYQLSFVETAVVRHRHRSTWKQLQSQWRRYGESNRYLHDLYGVDLMPDLTIYDYCYRMARWLLKEVPIAGAKTLRGQGTWVDWFDTPIGLLNVWARSQGQRDAQLPALARQIEPLYNPVSIDDRYSL